ncbi:MAG: FAD:protein FMN transferase, partial [Muribaculaceae bacterium]|nr:FAD:protein FMN transferase [Muribaculaceae bacterium]
IQPPGRAAASPRNSPNSHETCTRRNGHTISATTGRPIQTGILSASIIAPNCAIADALATATMAMPVTDAIEMLEQLEGVKAVITTSDSIYTVGEICNILSR